MPASYTPIKERTRTIPCYEFVSPNNGTFPFIVVSVLTYVALFICDLCYVTFKTSGGEGSKGRTIRE